MSLNRKKLLAALRSAVSRDSVPDCITRTKAALKPWLQSLNPKERPQKLLIPLQHSYTEEDLSFACLKCEDTYMVEVLKGYNNVVASELLVELRLCFVIEHIIHVEDSDEDDDTDFEIKNWVSMDDRKVNLSGMDIDVCTELIEDIDHIFCHDKEPDVMDYEYDKDCMGNYREVSHFMYNRPMLVVWPCKSTVTIVGRERLDGALDMVETKISRGERSKAETLFRDLLKLLCTRMDSMDTGKIVVQCRTCKTNARLLRLVSQIGDCKDMLKVIEVIGSKSCGHGIANMEVVEMLVLSFHTHGWDACGALVEKKLIRKSEEKNGCEYYAHLAIQFYSLNMHDAAMSVAKKVYVLVLRQDVRELTTSVVAAVMVMFFAIPRCHDEFASGFASNILKVITTIVLCAVIVKLKEADNNNVFSLKENPILIGILTKFCYELLTRNLNGQQKAQSSCCEKEEPDTVRKYIVAVMEVFLWLENASLLDGMVKALLIQAQNTKTQLVLRDIIGSPSFWQTACASESGSKALRSLVKERIRKLTSERKPVFSSFTNCSEKQQQARRRFFEKSEMEWYAGQKELEKLRQSIETIPIPLDRQCTLNEEHLKEVIKKQKLDSQAREPVGSTMENPMNV